MRGLREALDSRPVTPLDTLYNATMPGDTPADPVPAAAPPKQAPRLTVVERVTYQRPDRNAVTVTAGYELPLTTGAQEYRREMDLPPEVWTPLDTGWLKEDVSLVVVENRGSVAVWVGFGTGRDGPDTIPGLIIYPGQTHPLTPFRAPRIHLRPSGPNPIPVTITAVPS